MKIKSVIAISLSLMQPMLFTRQVEAYCVQNHLTSGVASVKGLGFREMITGNEIFKAVLQPGETKCCQFKDPKCSSGDKDQTTLMDIDVAGISKQVSYPAGGWIVISDGNSGDDYTTSVYDNAGKPFVLSFQHF